MNLPVSDAICSSMSARIISEALLAAKYGPLTTKNNVGVRELENLVTDPRSLPVPKPHVVSHRMSYRSRTSQFSETKLALVLFDGGIVFISINNT